MNGFLSNFCQNINIANYTSPFNQFASSDYIVEAILQCIQKNHSPQIIFTPICANSHWTLLILDFEKNRYFHYDPLQTSTGKGNQMIEDSINILICRTGIELHFYRIPHHRQNSNWECGYCVLLCCYKYAMGHPMEISPIAVNNLRAYLIEILNKSYRFTKYCSICFAILPSNRNCKSCGNSICKNCVCLKCC